MLKDQIQNMKSWFYFYLKFAVHYQTLPFFFWKFKTCDIPHKLCIINAFDYFWWTLCGWAEVDEFHEHSISDSFYHFNLLYGRMRVSYFRENKQISKINQQKFEYSHFILYTVNVSLCMYMFNKQWNIIFFGERHLVVGIIFRITSQTNIHTYICLHMCYMYEESHYVDIWI
jgi:hypothetical protein